MDTLLKKLFVIAALLAGVLWFSFAQAQQPPSDPALVAIEQDWQAASTAQNHLLASLQKVIEAYQAAKQKAPIAAFWEDACQSTPQCRIGKPANKP